MWVSPVVDDNIDIDILDKDLRVDTYRASGAGGQHVNTTDSAVRITHEPTGIVVQCQNDRSQHKNRATAMNMLKAKLYELELRKRMDAAQAVNDEKSDIGWGHQIRSYVLQPYQMVKDLRTGVETSQTSALCSTVTSTCSSKPLWRLSWVVTKRTRGADGAQSAFSNHERGDVLRQRPCGRISGGGGPALKAFVPQPCQKPLKASASKDRSPRPLKAAASGSILHFVCEPASAVEALSSVTTGRS